MRTNWKVWNDQYNDPLSHLSQRLVVVKNSIKDCLKELDNPEIISICSGHGKDILESLVETKAPYSNVTLIDLDQDSIKSAAAHVSITGLNNIFCVTANAELLSTYIGKKADLVIFVGALGHLSFQDTKQCLSELSKIIRKNGLIVWSANERVLENLLESFTDNGYMPIDLVQKISEKGHIVGIHKYLGEEKENTGIGKLFTYDEELSF